jgi:hypothetical protein
MQIYAVAARCQDGMCDMGKDTKKLSAIGVRFEPAVKKALEKAAADDTRPISVLVQMIVTAWLKEKKYLK